ncbi:MAG: hypothetical protein MI974_20240 [Chitinophagales bacterium]|nr:hypothetical protein [Chitinophagales bacterium]
MKDKALFILLLLFIMAACTNEPIDPKLEAAAAIHEEAIKTEQLVRTTLDSLKQHKEQLSTQEDTLSDSDQVFISRYDSLQSDLASWSENLIEVPGFEHHHHHHGEACHHDHGKKIPEVTPEHMLSIQKEFRDSIMAIKHRADQLISL